MKYRSRQEFGVLLLSPHPASLSHECDLNATLWRTAALCHGQEPDLWFPLGSEGGTQAIAICRECPVRLDCLRWAINHNERNGIWGGVSARRRLRMRAESRRNASHPLTGSAPGREVDLTGDERERDRQSAGASGSRR